MSYSSISIELGKGVLDHNNRKFIAENVDKNRTQNNRTYRDLSLEKAYHILFDDALQRYNDKQKRADRKIDNYLEHIQKSKQEKPFYEIIVQVGNREDMWVLEPVTNGKQKGFFLTISISLRSVILTCLLSMQYSIWTRQLPIYTLILFLLPPTAPVD